MVRSIFLIFVMVFALCSASSTDEHSRLFTFRSDPWVNLHHFLYHEARNSVLRNERLFGRVRPYADDQAVVLAGDQKQRWQQALDIYATHGKDHLLFDQTLFDVGRTVLKGPGAFPTHADAPKVYGALKDAMPIYQEHWWPRHDQHNQTRIKELEGYLTQYGTAMASRLEQGYGVAWPDEPVLVDVSNYSGRHGAYAHSQPNHIVLASRPNWFPGLLGLDLLFHEVGHTHPFQNQVLPRSRAAAKVVGVEEGDAWHAFLFYIPSQAAREVLPESHTPYAYFEDGPLVDGRMSRSESHIREALEQSDDLDEIFRLIHQSRAASASSDGGSP